MDTAHVDLQSLIGSWRRFGPVGVVYEVIGVCPTGPDGKARMRIRVLHGGEEVDYPLADLLNDPEES